MTGPSLRRPRILVVEDEPPIARLIAIYLQQASMDVEIAGDGLSALARFDDPAAPISLVVLDLRLPGLDGRGVCRRIRDRSDVPIIMVTALDDPADKLGGFGLGADDYITKPFDPAELVARVRAVLRRAAGSQPLAGGETIHCGNLEVDTAGRRVWVAGRPVELRVKEFDLLRILIENENRVLTRLQLYEHIWQGETDLDSRTLDVHISRLRERLHEAGATLTIDTIRAVGYRAVASRSQT